MTQYRSSNYETRESKFVAIVSRRSYNHTESKTKLRSDRIYGAVALALGDAISMCYLGFSSPEMAYLNMEAWGLAWTFLLGSPGYREQGILLEILGADFVGHGRYRRR